MPEKELEIEILQHALVTPIKQRRKVGFIGSIYDNQCQPHLKSLLRRNHQQMQFAEENYHPDVKTAKVRVKKAVYGGRIVHHYGHFLLETLSRVWALKDYPEEDVYFHVFLTTKQNYSFFDLNTWQQNLLTAALIKPERVHFITELTYFDELIVPEAGYVIANFFDSKQAQALAEIGQRLKPKAESALTTRKIWLSRSGLKKGAIAGEKELEIALQEEGFEIIHPELLSVGEQVQIFDGKNVIAGFTGSAFHTLVLSGSKELKLLHFSRIKNINLNYSLCAKVKDVEAGYYNSFIKTGRLKDINGNVLQDLEKTWEVLYQQGLVKTKTYHDSELELKLQQLDEETAITHPLLNKKMQSDNQIMKTQTSIEPSSKPMNHSARRIKALASDLNAQTYLEIGVNKGQTFLNVTIPHKTAVDPKFLFDTTTITDNNVVLRETISDKFFSTLPVTQKYNVIFIDGLHTFEQTYRDLCNSLLHSDERTVFLIDDTKPNDVYSTIPQQRKAVNYRKRAGGKGAQWHGDVFKVVFALHDFHPGLNYRTIVGSGNSQTLVWRSNTGWREPIFNSLEKISRLTYFDLLDHIDILRECSEDEAINLCLIELISL